MTVKYKDRKGVKTEKFKGTVEKTDIKITAQPLDSGRALLKIKNNTSQPFEMSTSLQWIVCYFKINTKRSPGSSHYRGFFSFYVTGN